MEMLTPVNSGRNINTLQCCEQQHAMQMSAFVLHCPSSFMQLLCMQHLHHDHSNVIQPLCVRSTSSITSITVYHKDIIQLDTLPSPVLALGIPNGLVQTSEDLETLSYLATTDCVSPAAVKNSPIRFLSLAVSWLGTV